MIDLKIGRKKIGQKHKPFIIAEMSGNHNQSLEKALAIVEAAAKAGVDAIKLQTYTADTMTIDSHKRGFVIKDRKSLWRGRSLYELYQQAYTPWEWHKPIFDRCKKLGMVAFSTPFDSTAVDFLESLKVPCYKIASFENIDIPLIQKVVATGKPVIISTGMITAQELKETVAAARDAGGREIVLLKCTSNYPAKEGNSNLRTMLDMARQFHCQVGISDHTPGIGVSVASIALGASIIEKHFTLSRLQGGVDSAFSLEPEEMQQLVIEVRRAWQSLGKVKYGPTKAEKKSMVFRRSLYIVRDIKKGDLFTQENLRLIRPGYGMPPKFFDKVLGKRARKFLRKGTPLSREVVAGI